MFFRVDHIEEGKETTNIIIEKDLPPLETLNILTLFIVQSNLAKKVEQI